MLAQNYNNDFYVRYVRHQRIVKHMSKVITAETFEKAIPVEELKNQ